MTCFKYGLISFMLSWVVIYLGMSFIEWEFPNPISILLEIPSYDNDERAKVLGTFIGWISCIILILPTAILFDPLRLNKKR